MDRRNPLPRGRHRLPREAVEASQRGRILDALVSLVAERSYAGTSVGAIATAAGVSRSTFYELFTDKEECFVVAYRELAGALLDALVTPGIATPSWRDGLDHGVRTYFTWLGQRPEAAVTFVVEVHTAGPRALACRAEVLGACAKVAAGLGRRARHEDPALPAVTEPTAKALVASLDALAHDYVRQGRAHELARLVPSGRYLAILLFAGHEEAEQVARQDERFRR